MKILIRSHKNSDELDENFLVIKKPGQKQIAIKLFENKLSWINNYCSFKKNSDCSCFTTRPYF